MASITILVDDQAGPGLLAEHGLALWIESAGKRILFDTGQGSALADNARSLGIDLSGADAIVLSHGHYDHTGGLAEALSLAKRAKVYLHPSAVEPKYAGRRQAARSIGMPEASRAALSQQPDERVCWAAKPLEVIRGIWLTGPIPRTSGFEDVGGSFYLDTEGSRLDAMDDDLAMWIDTPNGLAVVTGCAHAGIVNTAAFIVGLNQGRRIRGVVGGFHLTGAGTDRLSNTASSLGALSLEFVVPCHCSGQESARSLGNRMGGVVKTGLSGMGIGL